MAQRAVVIILDGLGVGAMPDAAEYGDENSNTLAHIADHVGGLNLPNLEALGLGKIEPLQGLSAKIKARASYGKMAEASPGKDSTTGHWELAGLILDRPFPVYPDGFPAEIIEAFKARTGLGVLGNKPASGTEIIKELGEAHLETGDPIIYTSADSVFQIAAHERVIPLEKLYELCRIARNILQGKHAVARVIARPFTGTHPDNFVRTKYRKDFSLAPFSRILHQNLEDAGIPTIAIGKINDLYAYSGIQKSVHTKSNDEGMAALIGELKTEPSGLIMINLVDFDMLWGHRNDPDGFYEGLREFDAWLPEFYAALNDDDLVVITADHGNDPTTISTDHSREYVPVLVFGAKLNQDRNLGVRRTFSDLEATLAGFFNIRSTGKGTSFLPLLYN